MSKHMLCAAMAEGYNERHSSKKETSLVHTTTFLKSRLCAISHYNEYSTIKPKVCIIPK